MPPNEVASMRNAAQFDLGRPTLEIWEELTKLVPPNTGRGDARHDTLYDFGVSLLDHEMPEVAARNLESDLDSEADKIEEATYDFLVNSEKSTAKDAVLGYRLAVAVSEGRSSEAAESAEKRSQYSTWRDRCRDAMEVAEGRFLDEVEQPLGEVTEDTMGTLWSNLRSGEYLLAGGSKRWMDVPDGRFDTLYGGYQQAIRRYTDGVSAYAEQSEEERTELLNGLHHALRERLEFIQALTREPAEGRKEALTQTLVAALSEVAHQAGNPPLELMPGSDVLASPANPGPVARAATFIVHLLHVGREQ